MSAPDLLRCALPAPDPVLAQRAGRPFLVDHARQALAHARAKPSHAAPRVARWFREQRRLGSKDRPAVQALVYGVARHESLLRRAGANDDEALISGMITILQGHRFDELEATEPDRDFATALSLPVELAGEWLAALGPTEAAALGASLGGRAPVTVRANFALCTRDQLRERLLEEGVKSEPAAGLSDALHLVGRPQVSQLRSFRDGWFEVQDAASQRFCEHIPMREGTRVLDLCAGAGGKSLALAARGARVRAHDVRGDALRRLEERAWRAQVQVRVGPPLPADVVVVDAPCSGSGRLRRDPFVRWRLDPAAWIDAQRQLIDQGAQFVLPDGILAYATCSLFEVENDHPAPMGDWSLVDARICWPHRDDGDGFGWRIWRRA